MGRLARGPGLHPRSPRRARHPARSGQLAEARGTRLDEADAVASVAAVAAGLGGNHAAPPDAPGQPGIITADTAAEENALLPAPAAGLRQLAAAHGLAADTARMGGTLTVTVHDQGRTVLLHDDISGTTAGGRRLDPAEVPAYLAAYVRHPQLPPRCLLDLARYDPAEPAPLTLTAARETAALHGLEVRVRRAGGQSYITFCEPGTPAEFPGDIAIPGLPVLSYPAGSDSARHGPCAVPVAAIGSYLAAYRENIPPAMLPSRNGTTGAAGSSRSRPTSSTEAATSFPSSATGCARRWPPPATTAPLRPARSWPRPRRWPP